MVSELEIRKATQEDHNAIWEVIREVIATGDTYVFAPNSSEKEMIAYWCNDDKYTWMACLNGQVVGTFFIKENFTGQGSHVANASYMVLNRYRGQGIGKKMGEFSVQEAKRLGFKAMQFNIVVKSNRHAVVLWQKLGFHIVGEIPKAFRHELNGLTDVYIMWREL